MAKRKPEARASLPRLHLQSVHGRKAQHFDNLRSMASTPNEEAWYKSLLLTCGLAALLLGFGNWMTGTVRAENHRIRLARAVLSTPTDVTAEEMEISRARVDFYRVVAQGGGWLMLAGSGSMLLGGTLLGVRRLATRRRMASGLV